MRHFLSKSLIAAVCLSLLWAAASRTDAAAKIPVLAKEDLKGMLDDPGVIIIDVRLEKSWKSSDGKIKGAVWEDPDRVRAWAGKYPKDKMIVLYCS